MKWPETLTLIRHDTSMYNRLKEQKADDPGYRAFRKAYDRNPESGETRRLATEVVDRFALLVGDHDTPLAPDAGGQQAITVGSRLKNLIALPDVIFVSPYTRTRQTLEKLIEGWPDLRDVKVIEDERIREQDHGIALLYSDWRVFNVFHPEQKKLRDLQSPYWYRYPQGENVPDLRDRLRSLASTLTRDYQKKQVAMITHHLAILAWRANQERLSASEFTRLDQEEKPINCGVTIYRGKEELGTDGKLVLEAYNLKLYTTTEETEQE